MLATQEEQLLDGVAMTTSISCSIQEQEYQLSEGSVEAELELSFNEDEESLPQLHPSRGPSPILSETVKTKSRCRSDRKFSPNPCKTNIKKTWEALFSLQDRLFQTHFIGLLETTYTIMDKLNQLIVTEEYGRLKTYERELIEVLGEVEFGLVQYQKQKKSMLAQIELLRMDNDHLNRTINELHNVIEDLEKVVANYFEKFALDPYLSKTKHRVPVPFARKFSHSVEEITLMKLNEDGSDRLFSVSQISALLLDLKKDSDSMLNGSYNQSLFASNALWKSFPEDSIIHSWTKQIKNNFTQLSAAVSKTKTCCSSQNFIEIKPKVIQAFLNRLSQSRGHFLQVIKSTTHKELELWKIIHTSLVTFLGILITETRQCPLQLSFGDSTKAWISIFLQEVKNLLELSQVSLKGQQRRYFDCIERLAHEIHELVIFRMMRNDN